MSKKETKNIELSLCCAVGQDIHLELVEVDLLGDDKTAILIPPKQFIAYPLGTTVKQTASLNNNHNFLDTVIHDMTGKQFSEICVSDLVIFGITRGAGVGVKSLLKNKHFTNAAKDVIKAVAGGAVGKAADASVGDAMEVLSMDYCKTIQELPECAVYEIQLTFSADDQNNQVNGSGGRLPLDTFAVGLCAALSLVVAAPWR